jgi:hypothetical protein
VRWRRIDSVPLDDGVGASPQARSDAHPNPSHDVESRVTTVVSVASRFGTGVSLPELVRLLPWDAPATVPEVRSWLEARPHLARVEAEIAFARVTAGTPAADRAERGQQYVRSAESLWTGPLRPLAPYVRCVCVTGSAAYGAPESGDDLDLFVATRNGALWWFIAGAYVLLRLTRGRWGRRRAPTPCFNFVLEESAAAEEFARSRGFLFAREALTARPVRGAEFYRGLLAQAPWMAQEIPRLYGEKLSEPRTPVRPAPPVSLLVRLLNAVLFPWIATYLQLVGLRRDARYRRSGLDEQRFRTETGGHRLAFASRKFDRLREQYGAVDLSAGRRAPPGERGARGSLVPPRA